MKTLPLLPSSSGGYLSTSPIASIHMSAIDDFDDFWSESRSDANASTWSQPQRLQDQSWYLGRIKRIDAVNLLRRDGDFLVRDSISNPGEYVLTGQCRGEAMHFEINRLRKEGADKYHFEGEHFPTIVDLIQFYISHRRQVTASSRFVLVAPVNTNITQSQSKEFSRTALQGELEAAYAPFMSKQSSSTLNRPPLHSLTQTAILNQTKKRLNESDHDLSFLPASTSYLGFISGHKSVTELSGHLKLTSFDTDLQGREEKTFVPPPSSRPVPRFSPPKPVPTCINDLDDYDDLDYDKMEPTTLHRSPPVIPPKPANLLKKRHSESDEASMRISMELRKHSAHNLHQTETSFKQFEQADNSTPPLYLDRAQSCSNLVYRQRTKSVKDNENVIDIPRYPSVKIDPAPLLPSRSRTSLGSTSALTISPPDSSLHDGPSISIRSGNRSDTFDYDDFKTSPKTRNEDYHDPDYDCSRKILEDTTLKFSEITPKPKTFAQLRAASQPARQVRHLLSFLSSVPPAKLSLLITIEDVKIFKLNIGRATESLRSLFFVENKALRDDILDRNACLQLTVSNTIQKSTAPKALFKVWVTAAHHLLQKVGNGFAFGALLSALKIEVSRKPKLLVDADAATEAIYRSLVPIYDDFLNGQMPKSVAGCFLPFIQPLLQLLSKSDYVDTGRIKNMHSEGIEQLDLLSNMIHLSRHVLFENVSKLNGSLKTMEQAASPLGAAINPLSTESLVHCLLLTSAVGSEVKNTEKKKIQQLYEKNF